MKAEIKDQWVQALRSGEYKQATDVLKSDVGFCCLGVLCDLAAKEGVGKWMDGVFVAPTEEDSLLPPDDVVNWAGLRTASGSNSNGIALSTLNDREHYSFDQIADHIERHWEEL